LLRKGRNDEVAAVPSGDIATFSHLELASDPTSLGDDSFLMQPWAPPFNAEKPFL
jgi:hypothetical protein